MSFSTANLAVVAYALVKADGTSSEINSGVKTTFLGSGEGEWTYGIMLPGNENTITTLQQGQGDPMSGSRKDLIHVSPIGGNPPREVGYKDIDEFIKKITIAGDGSNDFAVVVLRPTIPTPTDSGGAENGPT
jgi:hypothetical protein